MLTLACPGCRTRYDIGPGFAGKSFTCKSCGLTSPLPVPGGVHRAAAIAGPTAPADAWCPKCSRGLRVPPEKRNGWIACPSCALVFATGPINLTPPVVPPADAGRSGPPPLPTKPDHAPAGTWIRRNRYYVGGGVGGLLAVILIVWATRGTKPPTGPLLASEHALAGEEIFKRLIRVSALIITPRGSSGSGFVVDVDQKLVVTNYHVVMGDRTAEVIFPQYDRNGALITDARRGADRANAVRGEVIATDEAHDLALIRVERLAEGTTSVPIAEKPAEPGSTVYSVGGSGAEDNLLWRLTKGTVRGRAQRQDTSKFRLDSMILETDAPVNPGDSGGPVMNDRGELVAVVAHYQTTQRGVSGNIDVEEVRRFLVRHGALR